MSLTLAQLAKGIGAELSGDGSVPVSKISTLEKAGEGDIAFLTSSEFRDLLEHTNASAVILSPADAERSPVPVLVMDNPYLGYARASTLLLPDERPPKGIHPDASVDPTANIHPDASIAAKVVIEKGVKIASGVIVGAGCVIQKNTIIGRDSHLVANVTLCHEVILGERVIIQPGAVIGGDGFGFAQHNKKWIKIQQVGRVIIGNDVDIGANTTIDRGALQDTVIENGVKLDNLIQLAHNVRIGEDTAAAGCTGIAGSTTIGKRCTLGGRASISGHLDIVDDTHVSICSVVYQSIKKPGEYSSGLPLEEKRNWTRNYARFRQLDGMAKKITALEKQLQQVQKNLNQESE